MKLDTRAVADSAIRLLARKTRYVEPEILGLDSLVTRGSVCIDVGAAAGLYTLVLSQLVGPDGEVHSIEPIATAHRSWRWVLGVGSSPNVRRHRLALDAEPGRGVMSVPYRRFAPVTGRSFLDRNASGLGSNAEFSRHGSVDVEVLTLDELCERADLTRLDFIKIDVEGAELRILQGGEKAFSQFQPTVLVEIEGRHTDRYRHGPEEVVSWLTERGYHMFAWQGAWRATGQVTADVRNYLFRPAGAPSPDQDAPLSAHGTG